MLKTLFCTLGHVLIACTITLSPFHNQSAFVEEKMILKLVLITYLIHVGKFAKRRKMMIVSIRLAHLNVIQALALLVMNSKIEFAFAREKSRKLLVRLFLCKVHMDAKSISV